jgi:prolycopene isomerase
VLDASGEQHPAKAVIANAGVPIVFESLLGRDQVPSGYLEKLSGFEPSLSSFIVWLGLNKEIRGQVKGYEIFKKAGTDPGKAYQAWVAGNLENTDACVTIYDNLFEGYSQPGTSTVSILKLCGYAPWKKYEEDYRAGRKKAYRAEKERITRSFIDQAEQTIIPDLASMIEEMDAATPLTNRRYTRNPGGAIYGFNRTSQPLDVKTPIPGLYLASAWTHGGGYTPAMMAGRDAAQAVLKDWNHLA